MKTAKELNTDILNMTMKIQETHPELSKFISEMPVKSLDDKDDEITRQNLKDYYRSLETLLENYHKTHESESNANSAVE